MQTYRVPKYFFHGSDPILVIIGELEEVVVNRVGAEVAEVEVFVGVVQIDGGAALLVGTRFAPGPAHFGIFPRGSRC